MSPKWTKRGFVLVLTNTLEIMENKMSELEQLKHRLAMVEDDLRVIRAFVYEQGLSEAFQKPTSMADECWTHLNNIEIACDLSTDESLSWKLFSKVN